MSSIESFTSDDSAELDSGLSKVESLLNEYTDHESHPLSAKFMSLVAVSASLAVAGTVALKAFTKL